MATSTPATLPRAEWRQRAAAHGAAVDELTADHLARRERGERHPVQDFLFEYYAHSPGKLRRWHPGPDVALAGVGDPDGPWRGYTVDEDGTARLDVADFVARRGRTVRFVRDLVAATLSRPGTHDCFGLHEWAMVYRLGPGQQRHEQLPLRLGQDATDAVVERHRIRCSHFDAYRFFAEDAVERNTLRPTREDQVAFEQPACLHAGMDVYKWCFKLAPAIPSELTLEAFRHAGHVRELDMAASPYDLSGHGIAAVPIETAEGKSEYVSRQRDLMATSNELRRRLLEVIDQLAPGSG